MTTTDDLRQMSDEQLDLTVKEAAENLFRLKIQQQTERLDAPTEIRRNRRLIARVKTIQTERTTKLSQELTKMANEAAKLAKETTPIAAEVAAS